MLLAFTFIAKYLEILMVIDYKPFPHYIEIIEIPGRKDIVNVKTNTHLIQNAPLNQLEYITYPYAGIAAKVELKCKDKELQQAIYTALDKGTDLFVYFEDEHPVLQNAYSNWAHMYLHLDQFKSAQSLTNSAKGKDILFCGAGPSLTENMELVRNIIAEDKAIVIAGGSAARQMCKAGVFPHLALAFDPREGEKTVVFDHLTDEWLSKVPFVTNQGLYHDCFKRLGKAYTTGTSSLPDLCKWIEPNEMFINEGRIGVATMIPYLAEQMFGDTPGRLVMLGVDLCFGKDGKRYTDVDQATGTDNTELRDFEGLPTRLAWIREAVDIAQTSVAMKYKMVNAAERSLLQKMELESIDLADLLNNESQPFIVEDINKHETATSVFEKLEKMQKDFISMDAKEKGYQDAECQQTEAFQFTVSTYNLLQEMREIRTGDYNHVLLKHVVKNNLNWVTEALGQRHSHEVINDKQTKRL